MNEVRQTMDALTAAELEPVCVPPTSPGHPKQEHTVRACLHMILNEKYEHDRYAGRDLDLLGKR